MLTVRPKRDLLIKNVNQVCRETVDLVSFRPKIKFSSKIKDFTTFVCGGRNYVDNKQLIVYYLSVPVFYFTILKYLIIDIINCFDVKYYI